MFKNRSLLVKMIKDVSPEETQETQEHINWGAHAHVLIDEATTGVAAIIIVYMAADTLRKCIIHTVATKVN